ncbi:MAG: alpha-amylase [Ignavibacteria bacterium RBG_16_34_14]|nr:MAG: alpha-amylase [Ignavibacteria bacterium RBG_16_34_14]
MFLKIKTSFIFLLIFFFIPSELISQEIISVKHPEWSYNKVIYEVNLRQYTEAGTFKAFEEHLPRLKEMGVGILWLMPIHPIGEKNKKGSLGSYYSVKDYKAVNPEHGTLEDFKSLVDKIHKMGMYVIIDWVANHSGWDNVWVKEHPDFYTKDSLENFVPPVADWTDVIDLNYDNKELWTAMIDAMKFWVEEYDIDGFRCDVAAMIPLEFWLEARKELDNLKPVFLLAEAWEPELHRAFDMTYSWDVHHLMSDIAKGKKNAGDLKTQLEKEKEMYSETAFRMQFTSNHDENTWNGTVYEKFGDGAEAFAALTFMTPGMPLIYNGQEAGLNKRLQFFEKDPIEWKEDKFKQIYTKLCELKKENNALLSGEMGGTLQILTYLNDVDIFAVIRERNGEKIFSVFNLSGCEKNIKLESPLIKGMYKEFNSDIEKEFDSSASFRLKPWGYNIFIKIN